MQDSPKCIPPPPPPPPRRSPLVPPDVSMDGQTVVAEAEVPEINLRLALQADGFSHVVLKDHRNKTMGHVPNGYLAQLISEHTSGSSEIRTHDNVVGFVESKTLKIMSDEEILMAKAKMEDELGTDGNVDNDDGEVSVLIPLQFSLVECQPSGTGFTPTADSFHAPTVASASGSRAPITPQFGVDIQSPATPTVACSFHTKGWFGQTTTCNSDSC